MHIPNFCFLPNKSFLPITCPTSISFFSLYLLKNSGFKGKNYPTTNYFTCFREENQDRGDVKRFLMTTVPTLPYRLLSLRMCVRNMKNVQCVCVFCMNSVGVLITNYQLLTCTFKFSKVIILREKLQTDDVFYMSTILLFISSHCIAQGLRLSLAFPSFLVFI